MKYEYLFHRGLKFRKQLDSYSSVYVLHPLEKKWYAVNIHYLRDVVNHCNGLRGIDLWIDRTVYTTIGFPK